MEFDLAIMYAAELPTVLDCPKYTCMWGNTLHYGKIYIYYEVVLSAIAGSETILSRQRFNINCTRQVASQLLRCVVPYFFIRCSLQSEQISNRVIGLYRDVWIAAIA